MKDEEFERLVKQAKEDPQFFHDLIFDPEKALSKAGYLNRKAKASIISFTPEEVLGLLLQRPMGGKVDMPCASTCWNTCGGTCGESCAGGSCSWSCVATGGGCGAATCSRTCFGSMSCGASVGPW